MSIEKIEKSLSKEKKAVLELYCRVDLNLMISDCKLIPSTLIAREFNCTVYKARKLIAELVNKGLLKSGCQCLVNDYDEQNYIVRGYRITQLARETLTYKKLRWQEAKACSNIFGCGSAYNYYKVFKN